MKSNGFSKTQQKMMTILSDGRAHTRDELKSCLWDELAQISALQPHLTKIRKQLNPRGEDIICVFKDRRICYQHVRLLASANTGRT